MSNSQLPIFLFAFANDNTGKKPLTYLEAEKEQIKEALKTVNNKWIELKIIEKASINDIFDEFTIKENKDRIVAFHYGGHAKPKGLDVESDDGEENQTALVEGLAGVLAHQKNLELVFLNGCTTYNFPDFLLDEHNVKNVIATSTLIEDEIAPIFAKQFYKSLSNLRTVKEAYDDAKNRVLTEGDKTDKIKSSHFEKLQKELRRSWQLTTDYNDGAWKISDLVSLDVLVIHAKKDQALLDEGLLTHLAIYRNQNLIKTISQTDIGIAKTEGSIGEKELMQKVNKSDIILLFITPLLIGDSQSYDLVKRALHRQDRKKNVVIVPLLIQETPITGEVFERLVSLPRDGRFVSQWRNKEGVDAAYTHIAIELRKVIMAIRKQKGL